MDLAPPPVGGGGARAKFEEWSETGSGFKLCSYAFPGYAIYISSTSTANLSTAAKTTAGAPAIWSFAQYTGEDRVGFSVNFEPLIAGESYTKRWYFGRPTKTYIDPEYADRNYPLSDTDYLFSLDFIVVPR